VLGEVESKAILAAAGIPTVETVLAKTADDAVREAGRLGYRVALKVSAPEIVHKSDQGGVLLGIGDTDAVRNGFASLEQLATRLRATFEGVSVQPMAKPGLEIILGGHRDQQFGPVIIFGLGGVFVEVLHDVAMRVAPLSKTDAEQMVGEIRAKAMLEGARGQPAADRNAIVDALCRLSDLMLSRPDIASIDVNPAFVYEQGLLAVDARIELV
jgi:acyl-CoA synthetase (NDP forming)